MSWFLGVLLLLAPLPGAAARPNVLLIVSDDQGYGDVGIHGNPHLKTPHLDRLAAEGIRFDQFHVNPLCAPTRAALLTGRYGLRAGVHGVVRGEENMRPEEWTLAELLGESGWKTGHFGKWHNGEHFPFTPQAQGFSEVLGFNLGHWNHYFDTRLLRNGRWVRTRGYLNEVLTDAAIEFIGKHRRRPWFCQVAYPVPHSPFQCPEEDYRAYERLGLPPAEAAAYGMIANMDRNIGRLLERLERWGLRENTLVIFVGDNGPNGDRFNAGMRGRKGSLYLGGVRVPCFMRWPARFSEPRRVDRIAAHIDLLPTVAELCGLPLPPGLRLDGHSLVPLMEGQTDWSDRLLFLQNQPRRPGGRVAGSVRTERFHLVNPGSGWELYDLSEDPFETRNVAAVEPGLVKALSGAYLRWWEEVSAGITSERWVPVGHPQAPEVEVAVPHATFSGGVRLASRHANNNWAAGWENPDAAVTWNLEVVRNGRYQVRFDYLSPAGPAQGLLEVGEVRRTFALKRTDRRQVPAPDRVPREEAHELLWRQSPAVVVELPPGRHALRYRLESPVPGFELKQVILRRL